MSQKYHPQALRDCFACLRQIRNDKMDVRARQKPKRSSGIASP
ncbi:MAG TPA: hypothetical protein PKW17_10885 [Smithellaceae bacterium]|nr:hypothetical protein [Smithellaceae bacterium]HRS90202.1 hypothetical protein [Smithellaceae bacterium]